MTFHGVRRALETVIVVAVTATTLLTAPEAFAQAAPQADTGQWNGTVGIGASLTSGNSDTLNINLAGDATYDPKTRNVVRFNGLYLRGEQGDALVANRLFLAGRDQYALSTRTYVFGQVDYLRDTFKLIDYLVAPTGGLGVKLADSDVTKFTVDGGVGAVWEKNPGVDVQSDLALTLGERFEYALTPTSTIKHLATALWKANDLEDGLYTIGIGLGTAISEQWRLTVDVLDTFKNRPPTPETKKNDVALMTALTAKF